jgi:hypothetical protein
MLGKTQGGVGDASGEVVRIEGLNLKSGHAIGHAGHQKEREGLRSVGGASRRGRDAGWVQGCCS